MSDTVCITMSLLHSLYNWYSSLCSCNNYQYIHSSQCNMFPFHCTFIRGCLTRFLVKVYWIKLFSDVRARYMSQPQTLFIVVDIVANTNYWSCNYIIWRLLDLLIMLLHQPGCAHILNFLERCSGTFWLVMDESRSSCDYLCDSWAVTGPLKAHYWPAIV